MGLVKWNYWGGAGEVELLGGAGEVELLGWGW